MPACAELWLEGDAVMGAPWRRAIHKALHDALGDELGDDAHQAGQQRGLDTAEPLSWYAQQQRGGIRLWVYHLSDDRWELFRDRITAMRRIDLPDAQHRVTLHSSQHSSWAEYLSIEMQKPPSAAWHIEFLSPTVFRHLNAAWDSPILEYLIAGVCRRARLLQIVTLEPLVLQQQVQRVRGLHIQRQSLQIKGDTPTPCFTGRMTIELSHASVEWQQLLAVAQVVGVGWRVAYGFGAVRARAL